MAGLTLLSGLVLIGVLGLILGVLFRGGAAAFSKFGIGFLFNADWDPPHQSFGAFVFVFGTLMTSAIAVVVAVPVAVGLALLLNESTSAKFSGPLATFLDVLAAIPSVVYGLVGLFVIAPWLVQNVEPVLHALFGWIPLIGRLFPAVPRNAAGQVASAGGDFFVAGVVLAIMILPIITAISREVVATVPRDLREGAKALGATRYETIRMAVLPYSTQGIIGATFLGLGRALGETIAVGMLIGGGSNVGANLFVPGQSIAAAIAAQFNSATDPLQRSSLMALGAILVAISFLLALGSRYLVRRNGRRMEPSEAEVVETAGLGMS